MTGVAPPGDFSPESAKLNLLLIDLGEQLLASVEKALTVAGYTDDDPRDWSFRVVDAAQQALMNAAAGRHPGDGLLMAGAMAHGIAYLLAQQNDQLEQRWREFVDLVRGNMNDALRQTRLERQMAGRG